jgi:hypothetical protein
MGSPAPLIKMWQENDGLIEQVGVIPQLQYIAQEFVKTEWRKFKERGGVYYQDTTTKRLDKKELSANAQQLLQMGFSLNQAEEALASTSDDLEEAINLLTGNKSRNPFSKKKTKKIDTGAGKTPYSIEKSVIDAQRKKESFRLTEADGVLVGLIEYLTFRLGSLNEFCPLCDQGHMFGAPMLKPAICRRELCAFAFSKLGLMQDCVDGVAMQAEVVDLLVSMFKAAAFSGRAAQVCDPFPLIYDPKNPDEPLISDVGKHLHLAKEAVEAVKMSTMTQVSRSKNQGTHALAFPLMQWIVSSNRSHLVKLGEDKNMACLGTKFQFLMLSAPPEHEEQFSKQKKAHGSRWAFHGSRTENWHSILRNGLRNASGTKLQLNGAAYGKGVYLSPTASMSLGYSARNNVTGGNSNAVNDGFLDGTGFTCLAIVEVIKGAEKDHKNNIWTVLDDKQVVTRFFIVYPPGTQTTTASKVVSTSADFIKQVEHAMEGYE